LKTSVIIPSYNPTLKLQETLDKLVPQARFIDELIIIIDNNNYSDFANSIVGKYSAALKIKIHSQPNSGRAISRNKGVEVSSGDIIIFLDDDMLAEKDLIEKHIQYHLKNSDSIVSGNGYRNPENANAKNDFEKFLVNMENRWRENTINTGEITFNNFNFTACNMSIPKNIFERLGGFDSRFSDGEDFDFAVRGLNTGIRIYYDNTLNAWHNDWSDIKAIISRQKEYTNAKKEIFRIHPNYLKYFAYMLPKEYGWYKKLIASIFKSPLIWFVNSGNSIFASLPLKIKFILYDLTITSNTITKNN